MSKKIVVLTALCALSLHVLGQSKREKDIYLDFGISFPSRPPAFADTWKIGPNIGGRVGLILSPPLSLLGSIEYNRFALDGPKFLERVGLNNLGLSVSGGSISILALMGALKTSLWMSEKKISPYLLVGSGFMRLSTVAGTVSRDSVSSSSGGESESALAIHIGAGVDIPLGENTGIFIEGRYGFGFIKNEMTNYVPINLGLRIAV